MENLFIRQINLYTKNSNQFLNIQKFLQANSYYITTHKSEKKYYNSLLVSNGIQPKKVYAKDAKGSKTLSKEECSYIKKKRNPKNCTAIGINSNCLRNFS